MRIEQECVCCNEGKPMDIIRKYNSTATSQIICITKHPGFQSAVLDPWTLQIAYSAYRQAHGMMRAPPHRKMRYSAYRQLTRWCYGYLGKSIRVVLPSCATNSIRACYPSDSGTYAGFKIADMS